MNDVNIDDLAANFIASTALHLPLPPSKIPGRLDEAGAPDGVMIADHDGVIRFWNAGCARIFGCRPRYSCLMLQALCDVPRQAGRALQV